MKKKQLNLSVNIKLSDYYIFICHKNIDEIGMKMQTFFPDLFFVLSYRVDPYSSY